MLLEISVHCTICGFSKGNLQTDTLAEYKTLFNIYSDGPERWISAKMFVKLHAFRFLVQIYSCMFSCVRDGYFKLLLSPVLQMPKDSFCCKL